MMDRTFRQHGCCVKLVALLDAPAVSTKHPYPREWLDKVPATVFASLVRGEWRLTLHPGSGLAHGGAEYDVPIDMIPPELRVPNSKVWVKLDGTMRVIEVWRRNE